MARWNEIDLISALLYSQVSSRYSNSTINKSTFTMMTSSPSIVRVSSRTHPSTEVTHIESQSCTVYTIKTKIIAIDPIRNLCHRTTSSEPDQIRLSLESTMLLWFSLLSTQKKGLAMLKEANSLKLQINTTEETRTLSENSRYQGLQTE